jgi:hypothetical protein
MKFGEHGIFDVKLEKNNEKIIKFIKLDETEFKLIDLNISDINSQEEVVEMIDKLNLGDKNFYKIILQGNSDVKIFTKEILKLISKENVLKIEDNTKTKYDIDKIAKQDNLKGIFIQELLKQKENGAYSTEEIEDAIKIGLQLFE